MRAAALMAAALVLALAAGAEAAGDRIAMTGVTFVASRAAEPGLVLWAERAVVDVATEVVELERVHVRVAADGRRPGLELRCARGRFDLASSDFRLEGNVSGRSSDGRRFRAGWLAYERASALLYSDAPVVIYEAGGVYRGGRLRLDLKADGLRLLDGARVVRFR